MFVSILGYIFLVIVVWSITSVALFSLYYIFVTIHCRLEAYIDSLQDKFLDTMSIFLKIKWNLKMFFVMIPFIILSVVGWCIDIVVNLICLTPLLLEWPHGEAFPDDLMNHRAGKGKRFPFIETIDTRFERHLVKHIYDASESKWRWEICNFLQTHLITNVKKDICEGTKIH